MNAIVARFAIRGRVDGAAPYEAFRSAIPVQKVRKSVIARSRSARWTGSREAIEAPQRFAA